MKAKNVPFAEKTEDWELDKIEKSSKVSFDGKQLMMRIPTEIAEFWKLKQGDVLNLDMEIPEESIDKRKAKLIITIEEKPNG